MTGTLSFDHIAFKRLDPFFISFNDLIVTVILSPGLNLGNSFLPVNCSCTNAIAFITLIFKEGKGKGKSLKFEV